MLKQTLLKLREEQACLNKEVAVLITPALTQKRFNRERKWGEGVISRLWQKPHRYDFVARQILGEENWSEYESKVAIPTLVHLKSLEQETFARVIPDITYAEFCQIILSGQYKAVFLVAHHICKPNFDAIEFADGARLIKDVKEFLLQQANVSHKVSLLLFVCQASSLKKDIYEVSPIVQSIATASWNIPLHEGVRFIYHWVSCLDGKRTLTEAYNQAIQEFL